jgi:ribonuclease HII
LRYFEPVAIQGRRKKVLGREDAASGEKPLMTPAQKPRKAAPDFAVENESRRKKLWPVAGVDEVGRGPLAGPVCAAAVILDPANIPDGLNDSKAMSAKSREIAFARIIESALATSFAFVTAAEIDATDIRKASLMAMERAIAGLSVAAAFVLVDGRDLPGLPCPGSAIVMGDAKSLSIAAASIVAKVARDSLMRRLAEEYPAYGFETNAGYGSPRHLAALASLGPTPYHRMSFSPLRRG